MSRNPRLQLNFERVAPALFVALWSTGWITARFAADHASPLAFLVVRHALTAIALAMLALALRSAWPRDRASVAHAALAGLMIMGGYLGGVWWAISAGMPAGVSGLISAIQPILTALLAPALLGESITRRQWQGIALGFVGIVLVLQPKLAALDADGLRAALGPLAVNALAMVSVTLGTFYQKSFNATGDLVPAQAIQAGAAGLATLPVALLIEDIRLDPSLPIVGAMTWSVVMNSIGANFLLLMLLRRGAIARAAALIYLMPPVVAAQAYLMFGETLTPAQLAGAAVTVVGVALVTRR
ncbi:MAG: DMT family transporter [Alphaproteobacteria bacterium]|nr:DMT family transporter [Alphaproteobacteria bacterium]